MASPLRKPREIFDRDGEWESLTRFTASGDGRARLGIVYGRRRQGKSWLLERLAERSAGWYWEAIEATPRQQLDAFAASFGTWTKLPARPRFDDWSDALDSIWRAQPRLVVLDEFQHLVTSAPELPSLLQSRIARKGGPPLILCGSALGPMQRLLAADAPLRGRASMELIVRPFDYRNAARYWRTKEKAAAVCLHALVGGTPAYRDFAGGKGPADFPTFDDWVCEVLLSPAGALFREGRLLTDEPTLVDRGLYQGILSAVASGRTRRGQIAAALGRPENTLAHPLNALVELALIERIDDPLRARRSIFKLAEPLLRTYEILILPNESSIERRGPRRVWPRLRATAFAQIYGPHFEHLAREWLMTYASEQTLGGVPSAVGPSVASDPGAKKELEIDVVAMSGTELLAVGEAKWNAKPMGLSELERLEHKRGLLGVRAARAKMFLFGSSGFDRKLEVQARKLGAELVDLDRLYGGE